MPTTDSFGQGFTALDYGDVPDLKVLGDGLLKIVGQTGMRFATATARNATLTSPVQGMMAWLNSEKQLTVYDGTAWVVVAVGTRSWTTVTLTSGWSQNGNSQGNFQYRIVNLFGEDTIMLRGGISRSSYPSTMPSYFTLNQNQQPVSARPTDLRTISVPCSDVNSNRITLKLDITPDGWLNLYGADSVNKPPWVGFNGSFASL